MTNRTKIFISFERLSEISTLNPNRAILEKVRIRHEEDEYPDNEWMLTEIEDGKIVKSDRYTQEDIESEGLEKIQGWVDEDRKRYEEHGETWQSLCVQAVGIVRVPMCTKPSKSFTQQEITSFGLWGVESDALDMFQIEQEQVADLFDNLEKMCVIIPEEIQVWKQLFLEEEKA
jgi:hypothetical protein